MPERAERRAYHELGARAALAYEPHASRCRVVHDQQVPLAQPVVFHALGSTFSSPGVTTRGRSLPRPILDLRLTRHGLGRNAMSNSAPCRRARGWAAAGLLLAWGAGLGCASGDAADSGGEAGAGGAVGTAPHVRLGTGREVFEDVAVDGHVPLIMGLQGGYHVWTSFLVYELPAEVVRMELSTRWDGVDGTQEQNAGNVSLRPVTDGTGTAALAS